MRVCVAGMGKSGTTALVYAIRAAMPANTVLLFEPRTFVPVTAPNVAAKVLLHTKHPMPYPFYRQFERLVLIVRDPRDVVVSDRPRGGDARHDVEFPQNPLRER